MPESVSRWSSDFGDALSVAMRRQVTVVRHRAGKRHAAGPGPGPSAAQDPAGATGVGHAEVVVLGDDDLAGVGPAGRAVRVAVHLEGPEALLERVVGQQPALQGVADAEQDLDRLDGLDRPDDAGQHPEHAGLGAARRQLGRRRLGDHAAVAGPLVGIEDGGLALEPEDRAVHHRDPLQQRGVVDQVPGREVVRAVDDHVVAVDDVEDVVGAQPHVVGHHVDVGIDQRSASSWPSRPCARRSGPCCGGSGAGGSRRRPRPCR